MDIPVRDFIEQLVKNLSHKCGILRYYPLAGDVEHSVCFWKIQASG